MLKRWWIHVVLKMQLINADLIIHVWFTSLLNHVPVHFCLLIYYGISAKKTSKERKKSLKKQWIVHKRICILSKGIRFAVPTFLINYFISKDDEHSCFLQWEEISALQRMANCNSTQEQIKINMRCKIKCLFAKCFEDFLKN